MSSMFPEDRTLKHNFQNSRHTSAPASSCTSDSQDARLHLSSHLRIAKVLSRNPRHHHFSASWSGRGFQDARCQCVLRLYLEKVTQFRRLLTWMQCTSLSIVQGDSVLGVKNRERDNDIGPCGLNSGHFGVRTGGQRGCLGLASVLPPHRCEEKADRCSKLG